MGRRLQDARSMVTVARRMSRKLDEQAIATGLFPGRKRKTSRFYRSGAVIVAMSLVTVGNLAAKESSASTTATPSVSTAQLIQSPGPTSTHPALLNEALAACRSAGAADMTLCTGTVDAEIWGLPLVIMSHTRDRLACQIGVNHQYNVSTLAGPSSTSVVAPNDDTLYSTAFLDLRAEPQLLTVPSVSGRYVNFQLLDMYTNTIADIGVLTDHRRAGTYAFVGPGWHGIIPTGVVRIDVATPDAWLLGRTQVNGPADLAATVALQHKYSLTALTGHGSGTIAGPSTLACPASALPSSTSLRFLADLGTNMAADPPAAADAPVVRAMAAAGIGPGRTPGAARLGDAVAYLNALKIGATVLARGVGESSIPTSTGWTRGAVVGAYGTEYQMRAIVAKFGLAAQVPTQAVYFHASRARSGTTTTPLVGTRSYDIRLSARELPPYGSDGFWSITMYNAAGFLVANAIDRYSIGDHTAGLVRGHDGSITVVMSATRPTDKDVTWLPAPNGAFSLTLRVYDPTRQGLDGSWSPPPLRMIG